MAQQPSQVWWSFPGGIGWPTDIPLKGGKQSGATAKSKKTRKSKKSKKTRKGKGKKMTRRR
jgi:hypothetical protein